MSDMHPEDIKASLRKRGTTLSQLADENGVSKQTVGAALRGRASARSERIIADALDLKPCEIWPSRYRADGKRIMLRRSPDKTRKNAGVAA